LRLALIANPHASRFSGRQRDRVVATLGAAHKLELLQTGHAGQATELARQAVAGGAEVVAVLGGDGTVNEVANGLPIPAGDGPLVGLLPAGANRQAPAALLELVVEAATSPSGCSGRPPS